MELDIAVKRLSALAQDSRLTVFRRLVNAGPDGAPAGEIARDLAIPPSSLSAQLKVLANAGLVVSRRNGRSIIYAADFDGIGGLLLYLTDDCCQGRPEVCGFLTELAARSACCAPPQGALAS